VNLAGRDHPRDRKAMNDEQQGRAGSRCSGSAVRCLNRSREQTKALARQQARAGWSRYLLSASRKLEFLTQVWRKNGWEYVSTDVGCVPLPCDGRRRPVRAHVVLRQQLQCVNACRSLSCIANPAGTDRYVPVWVNFRLAFLGRHYQFGPACYGALARVAGGHRASRGCEPAIASSMEGLTALLAPSQFQTNRS